MLGEKKQKNKLVGFKALAEWNTHTHTHKHTDVQPQWSKYRIPITGISQLTDWSGRRHLCLLKWCVWTCVCVCACVHRHTLHSSYGWSAGCPPVSCHHWIWNALWQISSAESGEKWACPTSQYEEEEKVQHGGELVLLLIAVCPIPTALGKSLFLFLWLNHSRSLHCRHESPFVTLLRSPPCCSFSFPSVSTTKTVKSTSGHIIA